MLDENQLQEPGRRKTRFDLPNTHAEAAKQGHKVDGPTTLITSGTILDYLLNGLCACFNRSFIVLFHNPIGLVKQCQTFSRLQLRQTLSTTEEYVSSSMQHTVGICISPE